jgi:hypothetical protein
MIIKLVCVVFGELVFGILLVIPMSCITDFSYLVTLI